MGFISNGWLVGRIVLYTYVADSGYIIDRFLKL